MKPATKNFINLIFDITLAVLICCNLYKYCSDSIHQLSSGDFSENAFSYFTTLSNLFVVVASLIEAVTIIILFFKHKTSIPKWIQYIKAISTITVGLTMILVAMAFISRTEVDIGKYFLGREMISHIISPLISITQFMFFGGEVIWWKVLIPAEIFGGLYSTYYVYNTHITNTWGVDPYNLWDYGFWVGMLIIGVCAISILLLTFLCCFFHNKFTKKFRKFANENQKWTD